MKVRNIVQPKEKMTVGIFRDKAWNISESRNGLEITANIIAIPIVKPIDALKKKPAKRSVKIIFLEYPRNFFTPIVYCFLSV